MSSSANNNNLSKVSEKREGIEKVEAGQHTVYYDATERSQLVEDPHIISSLTHSSIAEETSPWTENSQKNGSGVGLSPSASNVMFPHYPAHAGPGTLSVGTPSVPLSETATSTFADDDTVSAWEGGSYVGHLRSQSTLTRKWLNDVDIEPYIRVPNGSGGPSTSGGGRGKREAGRKPFFREPLLEELLPTSRKETLFPAIHGPVSRKDMILAYIYGGLMTLMFLMGILLLFVSPNELRDSFIRSHSMLRAIVDSTWILVAAIAVGSAVSVLWMICIRWFASQMVHLMLYFAPGAMFVAGIWASIEFLHSDSGGGFWLLIVAVAGLAVSTLSATYLVSHRKEIATTINIVRMATEVLTMNPSILVVSAALFLSYLVFVLVWMLFFVHTLMLGHVDVAHRAWILSGLSYYLQFFFGLMLLWTSIIFSYLQKAVIGGVVGRWYFFRSEIDADRRIGSWATFAWESFQAALLRFSGQICFASLIITLVRCTRFIIKGYKLIAARLENGLFAAIIKSANLFFGFLERFLEHVSEMAIYVVVLTGDNFWTSSRSVFKIFRRNMIVGFTTDMVAQIIFMASTLAAASIVGLGGYFFITHILNLSYGFNGAIIYGLICWYVLRFFTSIFSDTYLILIIWFNDCFELFDCRIDAAFVCYAIDLDTEKLHSPTVHQAFAHRIVSEQPV